MPRPDPGRWVAALLASIVLLAACEEGLGAPEPVPTPEPGEAPGLDGALEEEASTEQADGPLGDSDPAVDTCDDQAFEALDGVVGDQLDAFAAADWERAYRLATQEYREGVSLEQFTTLIREHFPVVADPAGHTSTDCLTDGTRASIVVTVTGRARDSRTYLYVLEREDGGWRIGGATASAAPQPGDV